MFVDGGNLLAAVGETGGIYRIGPQGDGQQMLKAEENHILCLRQGSGGEIFAGTGGVGVVYRISAAGRASALFESAYEEIRSLALDAEGRVYAAAGGSPSRARKEEAEAEPVRVSTEVVVTASAGSAQTPRGAAAGSGRSPLLRRRGGEGAAPSTGSTRRIARKLWDPDDEIATPSSLASLRNDFFGTGTRAAVRDRQGRQGQPDQPGSVRAGLRSHPQGAQDIHAGEQPYPSGRLLEGAADGGRIHERGPRYEDRLDLGTAELRRPGAGGDEPPGPDAHRQLVRA
jgi:hypothetical protein